MPTLTLAWGVVTTLFGVVKDTKGFYVARFFLGLTESGLFPGVVYYLSMWYEDPRALCSSCILWADPVDMVG